MFYNAPPAVCPDEQALVDAPGRARDVVNFKRLALTDYKVDIPRLASKKVLTAEFSKAGKQVDDALRPPFT